MHGKALLRLGESLCCVATKPFQHRFMEICHAVCPQHSSAPRPCRARTRRRRDDFAGYCRGDGKRIGGALPLPVGRLIAEARLAQALFCGSAAQLPGRFHFAAKPFGGDIEAIWPSRRAEFQEYAAKKCLVPQRLQHRAGLLGHRGKVVGAPAPVIEPDAQSKAAKLLNRRNLSQHRDPRSSPAVRLHGRGANSRATAVAAPAPIP